MADPAAPDPRLAAIYAESVRALESQATYVDDLRGRALTMLGIIVGASGLIGAVALDGRSFDGWAGVAAVAFVVAMFFARWATLSRGFRFGHDPEAMLAAYVDGTEHERTLDDLHRWLATYNGRYYVANRAVIEAGVRGARTKLPGTDVLRGVGPLFCLRVASAFLAVEVVAWVMHLRR